MGSEADLEILISEVLSQSISGWDFRFLRDRMSEEALPWDYGAIVRAHLNDERVLLDMGTGGGEFLSSIVPLPRTSIATEGYPPNVAVAYARLAPLGVPVVQTRDKRALPFADATFDLMINRHAGWWATEIQRLLKPGGLFITQQVGGNNLAELNRALGADGLHSTSDSAVGMASEHLRAAGMEIVQAESAFPVTNFTDVGAIIYYLRVVAWQVRDFDVARFREQLGALHGRIRQQGTFTAHGHRYLIVARK